MHLNEYGIEQAKLVSFRLSDISFDEIISSDLLRAIETAKIIHLNHSQSSFQTSSLLRERSLGLNEGQSYKYYSELSSLSSRDIQPTNGESINDVFIRAQTILNDLIQKYANQSYSINSNTKSTPKDLQILSYKAFEDEFHNGNYTNQTVNKESLPKLALVTHCVFVKELLNNILVHKYNQLIEWIQVKNTGIFKISIFCPNCLGKCISPIKCSNELCFSIDIINDYLHLNN